MKSVNLSKAEFLILFTLLNVCVFFSLFSRRGRQSTLRLKDHFNAPHLFQRDLEMADKFARTFTKQNIQQFDSFITRELTNHLFEVLYFTNIVHCLVIAIYILTFLCKRIELFENYDSRLSYVPPLKHLIKTKEEA